MGGHRHFDSAWPQRTQQRENVVAVRKVCYQSPEFLLFKENVRTGAMLLNKVPSKKQWLIG